MSKEIKNAFAKRKAIEEKKAEPIANTDNDIAPFVAKFTQEKIDTWNKQFAPRKLIYLKVENDLAVLRPPTADDLGDYMTAIGSSGMSKAVAMIVEQLWLDGDYSLIEDEDSFIAVFLQVNNILEGKKAAFFRF